MHDHPILSYLRSHRQAMIAELRRLVEHESPSRNKAALDSLVESLAERLSKLGGTVEIIPNSEGGEPRSRAVSRS